QTNGYVAGLGSNLCSGCDPGEAYGDNASLRRDLRGSADLAASVGSLNDLPEQMHRQPVGTRVWVPGYGNLREGSRDNLPHLDCPVRGTRPERIVIKRNRNPTGHPLGGLPDADAADERGYIVALALVGGRRRTKRVPVQTGASDPATSVGVGNAGRRIIGR